MGAAIAAGMVEDTVPVPAIGAGLGEKSFAQTHTPNPAAGKNRVLVCHYAGAGSITEIMHTECYQA